jgi:hypothetical protein
LLEERAVAEPDRFAGMSPRVVVLLAKGMNLTQLAMRHGVVWVELDSTLEHQDSVFMPALHAKEYAQGAARSGPVGRRLRPQDPGRVQARRVGDGKSL